MQMAMAERSSQSPRGKEPADEGSNPRGSASENLSACVARAYYDYHAKLHRIGIDAQRRLLEEQSRWAEAIERSKTDSCLRVTEVYRKYSDLYVKVQTDPASVADMQKAYRDYLQA